MRILVIRTSAMGDVALVAPVIAEMEKHYPDVEIVMLTRSSFKAFFRESDKLSVISSDFPDRHRGIPGLYRLYRDIIKQGKIDHVIDLHDVIRSKILRFMFMLGGIPVSVIDKGRKEKADLIRGKKKVQLKHTVLRYCQAFADAGFALEPSVNQSIVPQATSLDKAAGILSQSGSLNIGIAPYAKHKLKLWPEDNMVRLLNMISEKYKVLFLLFGGREESEQLEILAGKVSGSVNLAGKLSLEEELGVMSRLDFMIAMDSSNMHMAALVGAKVISIWGGTDPLNGFGAWMQPGNFTISIPVNELICRPCTTYGKGECSRGDFACMNWQTPEMVFQKLDRLEIWK